MKVHYGITSTSASPETLAVDTEIDDVAQSNRICKNVLRSKRPAGEYLVIRWPAGRPWDKTVVSSFTKAAMNA